MRQEPTFPPRMVVYVIRIVEGLVVEVIKMVELMIEEVVKKVRGRCRW